MKISTEMIERLERLSRIELSRIERERLASQLERIISYIKMLDEVEAEELSLLRKAVSWNDLRMDKEGESLRREEILLNVPDFENGFLRVPSIIELKK